MRSGVADRKGTRTHERLKTTLKVLVQQPGNRADRRAAAFSVIGDGGKRTACAR